MVSGELFGGRVENPTTTPQTKLDFGGHNTKEYTHTHIYTHTHMDIHI